MPRPEKQLDWPAIIARIQAGEPAASVAADVGVHPAKISRHRKAHPDLWARPVGADVVRPDNQQPPPPPPPGDHQGRPPALAGEHLPADGDDNPVLVRHRQDLMDLSTMLGDNRQDIAECQRLIRQATTATTKATQERAALQLRDHPPAGALAEVDARLRTLEAQRTAIQQRLSAAQLVLKALAVHATSLKTIQEAERRAHRITDETGAARIQLYTIIQQITGGAGPSNAVTLISSEEDRRGEPSRYH